MQFRQFLESSQDFVTLDLDSFERQIRAVVQDTIDYSVSKFHQLKTFQPDMAMIQRELADYPQKKLLMAALGTNRGYQAINNLYGWFKAQGYPDKIRTVWRQLSDYNDKLTEREPASMELYEGEIQKVLQETRQNMLVLKGLIDQAISRIPNWSSKIKMTAEPGYEYNRVAISPATSATICFTRDLCFGISHYEQKIEIDDIIEGDEDDFFPTPQIKSNYYSLINELKKPGSTSKGKILTLYTARPVKDREQFSNATSLPINIFLGNNLNHVEGLSVEYGGRDIYRVRIDSKYLIQTLDGSIKYYQVVVDNAPASVTLLSTSES